MPSSDSLSLTSTALGDWLQANRDWLWPRLKVVEKTTPAPDGQHGQALAIAPLRSLDTAYHSPLHLVVNRVIPVPLQADPSPKKRKASVKRPRILKPGSLTLAIFGADESCKWELRAAAFANAVRATLGDRCLKKGQWGGSVLDSVVGAFLTQNVADALSSQAFMTLAARYPRQACSHGDRTPEDGLSGDSPAQGSNQLCDHSSSTSTSLGSSQTCALLDSKVHAPADPATDAESLQPGGIPMPGSLPELAVGLQQSSTSASAEPPREADRPSYQDIVDWEAVMAAPAEALADAIKCRGFHNNLSLRIQALLGRIKKHGPQDPILTGHQTSGSDAAEDRVGMGWNSGHDQASHPLDLEWLRLLPDQDALKYLMSIMGLGRKSAACIMLLCLGKKDFPVDTNVGRIAARLGWIPLDAEQALEDLDQYAPEPEVHKYLHSRMMRFSVETLYELHYQMITLGKVLCTKREPNCLSCPLRNECEYARNNGRCMKSPPRPGPDASSAARQHLPDLEEAAPPPHAAAAAPFPPAAGNCHEETCRSDSYAESALQGQDDEVKRIAQLGQQLHNICAQPAVEGDARNGEIRLLHLAAAILKLRSNPGPSLAEAPLQEPSLSQSSLPASCSMAADRYSDSNHAIWQDSRSSYSAPRIRRRFRELSVLVHPDKCSHPSAEQAFAHVRRAQDILLESLPQPQRDVHPAVHAEAQHAAPQGSNEAHEPAQSSRLVKLQALRMPRDAAHLLPAILRHHCSQQDLPLLLPMPPATPPPPQQPAAARLSPALRVPMVSPADGRGPSPPCCSADLAQESCWQVAERSWKIASGISSVASSHQEQTDAQTDDQRAACLQFAVLVPVRSALKGRFPLNGTYFQVNEVFLAKPSLCSPIELEPCSFASWDRVQVHFGSNVASICRRMRQWQVAHLFATDSICIRAYDPVTGAPHPLPSWLIQPATPITKSPRGKPRADGPNVLHAAAPVEPQSLHRKPAPPFNKQAITQRAAFMHSASSDQGSNNTAVAMHVARLSPDPLSNACPPAAAAAHVAADVEPSADAPPQLRRGPASGRLGKLRRALTSLWPWARMHTRAGAAPAPSRHQQQLQNVPAQSRAADGPEPGPTERALRALSRQRERSQAGRSGAPGRGKLGVQAGGVGASKRMRIVRWPPVPASEKCGHCRHCMQPHLKQACITWREAWLTHQALERVT